MARPLRYEAAGAVYHVMARGDGGKTIFDDDKDRYGWLDLMERAGERFGWRAHAWGLMGMPMGSRWRSAFSRLHRSTIDFGGSEAGHSW